METKTVKYINVNGKLMDLSHPQVMGILNVTPDSFYAGSRTPAAGSKRKKILSTVPPK